MIIVLAKNRWFRFLWPGLLFSSTKPESQEHHTSLVVFFTASVGNYCLNSSVAATVLYTHACPLKSWGKAKFSLHCCCHLTGLRVTRLLALGLALRGKRKLMQTNIILLCTTMVSTCFEQITWMHLAHHIVLIKQGLSHQQCPMWSQFLAPALLKMWWKLAATGNCSKDVGYWQR